MNNNNMESLMNVDISMIGIGKNVMLLSNKEIKIKDGIHFFNSLLDKMICYRHSFYDGRYVTEAKRRGIKCN